MAMQQMQKIVEETVYERDADGVVIKETKTTTIEAEMPTPEEEIFG